MTQIDLEQLRLVIREEQQPLILRFDMIESRFDNLEKRFGILEERMNTIEQRFDRLEMKYDELEGRFDSLEQKVDTNYLELKNLIITSNNTLMEEIRRTRQMEAGDIEPIYSDIKDHEQRITKLEQQTNRH